jgi:hypothetical protein
VLILPVRILLAGAAIIVIALSIALMDCV